MTINDLSGQTQKFADALYDFNTLEMLVGYKNQSVDVDDCTEWAINEDEYFLAIDSAINENYFC